MPLATGNGLAMRAGALLDALACRYDVHLLVVPVAGGALTPSRFAMERATRVAVLDLASYLDPHYALIARVRDAEPRRQAQAQYPKPFLARFCTGESADYVSQWAGDVDAIHVMRLYLAPLAGHYLKQIHRPLCILDLDDDEMRTRERLAGLYDRTGNHSAADSEKGEARKYQVLAERYLPMFDRVLVCAPDDAQRLQSKYPGAHFAVVPNGYRAGAPAPRTNQDDTLRLLFVGTLGYFPNEDAARFLCREIVPALRRLSRRNIRVDLVGGGPSEAVLALGQDADIHVHGYVEDLTSCYATADIAVVPVRAGGGTRIKILEAFAQGVPVVATRVGAEGIDAADGTHLMLADDPESFARACLGLKDDAQKAAALAARAALLLDERYAPERIAAALTQAYETNAVPDERRQHAQ